MSRLTLYLIAAVALAALVLFFEGPFRSRTGDILDQPLLKNFHKDQVTRLEIEQLLQGIQLEKRDGVWQVALLKEPSPEWHKANGEKLELGLTSLEELTATSLVGENPERHGFFEVNAAGMQIRAFDADGKKLVHLFVGKTGPGFTESYVRLDGDKKVYLSNRYLRSSFPPDVEAWKKLEQKPEVTK